MSKPLDQLRQIIQQAFSEQGGCAWMRAQDYSSIARYSIEEVYELWDAISRQDVASIKEELADLCLHTVIYAELAQRQDWFTWEEMVQAAVDKQLKRRVSVDQSHPSEESAHQYWHQQKNLDRQQLSLLEDIPDSLPPLLKADQLHLLQQRLGFSTPSPEQSVQQLLQSARELQSVAQTNKPRKIEKKLGELLKQCVSVAISHGLSADAALHRASATWCEQWRQFEDFLHTLALNPRELSTQQIQMYWQQFLQTQVDESA